LNDTAQGAGPSQVERVKEESNYLRGSIVASLANPITGALAESDAQSHHLA